MNEIVELEEQWTKQDPCFTIVSSTKRVVKADAEASRIVEAIRDRGTTRDTTIYELSHVCRIDSICETASFEPTPASVRLMGGA